MSEPVKRKDFHMIEPDKDIILYCDDCMGDFKVYGRMVKYKQPQGRNKTRVMRFCTFNNDTQKYETDSDAWAQRNAWSYK